MNDAEAILNMKRSVHQQLSKVQEKGQDVNRLVRTSEAWWSGEVAEAFDAYYKKLSKQLEYEYNLISKLEGNLTTLSTNVTRAINEEKAQKASR